MTSRLSANIFKQKGNKNKLFYNLISSIMKTFFMVWNVILLLGTLLYICSFLFFSREKLTLPIALSFFSLFVSMVALVLKTF